MNIQLAAQDYLPLYPDAIPNSNKTVNEEKSEQSNSSTFVRKISIPTIRYFAASEKNAIGTVVIIFPGGGYESNSLSHEGEDVARKFNEIGVAAFVVKYRIPDDKTMPNKEIGPFRMRSRQSRSSAKRRLLIKLMPIE
jgi:acetyl esterase/lipase